MDTRSKILSGESAVETGCRLKQQGKRLCVVTGYFDVILAADARDLGVRKGTGPVALMVVLLTPPDPILGERARAELMAGLDMVDYVVTAGEGSIEALLRRLPADEVVPWQTADEERMRYLIEHVHSRHS